MTPKVPRISRKQIEAVTVLPAAKRYSHFVKMVADWENAWGLYEDGWALVGTASELALPLWPSREYAEQYATGTWSAYQAKPIEVHHLLDVLLPKLEADQTRIAVFPTPADKGVILEHGRLASDLRNELAKME